MVIERGRRGRGRRKRGGGGKRKIIKLQILLFFNKAVQLF